MRSGDSDFSALVASHLQQLLANEGFKFERPVSISQVTISGVKELPRESSAKAEYVAHLLKRVFEGTR